MRRRKHRASSQAAAVSAFSMIYRASRIRDPVLSVYRRRPRCRSRERPSHRAFRLIAFIKRLRLPVSVSSPSLARIPTIVVRSAEISSQRIDPEGCCQSLSRERIPKGSQERKRTGTERKREGESAEGEWEGERGRDVGRAAIRS